MVLEPKTNFYLAKRWFWRGVLKENHLFASEKLVFLCKTIFLRGKTKKNIFFKIPSPFSKQDGFLGFWFCLVPLSGQNRSALYVAVQWTVWFEARRVSMLGGSFVLVSLILISAIAFLFLLM